MRIQSFPALAFASLRLFVALAVLVLVAGVDAAGEHFHPNLRFMPSNAHAAAAVPAAFLSNVFALAPDASYSQCALY